MVVIWDDAASDDGDWEAWEDIHIKPIRTFSAGWLLEETKTHVVICNTLNGLSHTSGRLVVPYKMLHSMTVVGQSTKSHKSLKA